jgi:hypothetical protein
MRKIAGLLCLLLLMSACQASPLDRARESVSIGDLREEAIEILNAEAWYHQPCKNRSSIDDLFFYGDQHYDRADIVIVNSILEDGRYRVSKISSFEPHAWHAAYADCIDRDRFQD